MLISRIALLFICVASLVSCKRNRVENINSFTDRVKTIEWKDGSMETWGYDDYNILTRTNGKSPTSAAIDRDFLYNDKLLGLVQKPSIKEDTFYYNTRFFITRIEEYEMGLRQEGGVRLDFIYNGEGKVIKMDYGRYKGATYTPIAVSQYTWNAQGLLLQIKTVPAGKPEEYIYALEPDSRSYLFSEWAFPHRYNLVDFQYEIWNLPVLQSMDRLPRRISWTKKVNGQVTDQTSWDFNHEIDQFDRLTRRTTGTGDWMKFTYQPAS